MQTDTIAAIATPGGRGGIGVVRISGPAAATIGKQICGHVLAPRHATLCDFRDAGGELVDRGIALFFAAPHSYTGEDVLELQGHGNSFLLDDLLSSALAYGARMARPGEFTERAYLNDKIDLAQAEAIADTIASHSRAAARSAVASLTGAFSEKVDALLASLTQLRTYVEATIDFPEEDIDLPSDKFVSSSMETTLQAIDKVLHQAEAGNIIREGLSTVIVGAPNVGKSSLLNQLSGEDIAIVSEQAGTTRDMLRAHIELGGIPLQLADTAGLRESTDAIEREGMRRASEQVAKADVVILVKEATGATHGNALDSRETIAGELQKLGVTLQRDTAVILLLNKIDLFGKESTVLREGSSTDRYAALAISAKVDPGIELIAASLRQMFALQDGETSFTARRRHISILQHCAQSLVQAQQQLQESGAAELFAEDLRKAQEQLGEITGRFSSDDLLGEIFSTFCIGK